ncbi:MAG: murein biosynthesis integral membrane protein MurJ [Acidobacteriota bacterium]|nr:murein biosynthesis integral membrane protein MurJ [Acidobacteriota bacterium]
MKKTPGLLRSAGVISIAVAASRITGLVREGVLSWLFGAGAIFDAFVLGYRIPNLARDLFAEGALASAFVPTFTRYLTTKTHEEARELSDVTGTLLLAITGAICAAGMIFAPAFVSLFAPGFHAVPGKFEMAAQLVRIMFPFLALIALSAQAQGILNACHRFGLPALSSTLFNIGSVAFGLTFGYWLGPRIGLSTVQGMAAGVVVGGGCQVLFLMPSLWKAGFAWRLRWNPRHEGLRDIMRLMGPAVIAGASVQINVLVNTNFAASLRDAAGHVLNGPVSWLSYAFRFQQLPMGLFGISIASAALPRLSLSAARADIEQFRSEVAHSLTMILLTTIPASVGLAVLGESMIGIVYQHGRFSAHDTHQTAIALSCYAIGLGAFASLKLLAPAFYALGDSRTPMLVSVAAIAVNAASAWTSVRLLGFGHAGLALSLSVVSVFNAITLLSLLSHKLGGVHVGPILVSLAKIVAAAGVMGAVCLALTHGLQSRALNILVAVPVGTVVFYSMGVALRIPELVEARAALIARIGSAARG